MDRTGKILIFFVPGRFDEALEVNLDSPESELVSLIQGQGLLDKRRQNGYRTVQAKRGESPKRLTARVFEILPKEVTEYSVPRRVFEALKDARSTLPRQTQTTITRRG